MAIFKNLLLNLKNSIVMKIKEALTQGIKQLEQYHIDSAPLDAELLLSFVLNKDKACPSTRRSGTRPGRQATGVAREYLYTYPETELNNKDIKKYQKLIKKRSTHYPLAYILGYKEFYGLKFEVNKHVLIPRPETELLVEKTLKIYQKNAKQKIIEIGTGSGCIAISLVKNGINNIIATDISKQALKVAKKNAKIYQVENKIKFLKGDLLKPLQDTKIDILIANLPYLDTNYKKESSIKHEPNLALYSGEDGLDAYKKLFKQISELAYQPQYILIELDPEQIKILSSYTKKLFPSAQIQTKKDLQGLGRIMIVKIN